VAGGLSHPQPGGLYHGGNLGYQFLLWLRSTVRATQ
jgi:hypothetical protein